MITLRPYQERAIQEARHATTKLGKKRVLVCLATGGGKTVIFSHVIAGAVARGNRVLLLAHRKELIRQPFVKLIRAGVDPNLIGVILAGVEAGAPLALFDHATCDDRLLWDCFARRNPSAPIQVASIDTIRNRAKPEAGIVIIDEAHRTLSASYMALADCYPNAVFLGFTATPIRADNKPLGSFYEHLVLVATYAELAAEGFLVTPRVYAPDVPKLDTVKVKGGDYDADELAKVLDQGHLVGNIVEHWRALGNSAATFCFAINVDHSKHIAQRFVEAGIPAEHVDGETDATVRDGIFERLRSGAIKVVCNVDVATEGVDIPNVKTVVLARPTKSVRVYLQQVGRGSRPFQGSPPFVVLDHAGCTVEHGLPHRIEFTEEVLWAPKSRSAVSRSPAKSCPNCLACLDVNATACPECGHEFKAKPRGAPEEVDGELILVSGDDSPVEPPTEEELREAWATLCAECVAKGFKPGWVWAQWGERYPGVKPPAGCVPPAAEAVAETQSAQLVDLDARVRKAIEKGHKPGAWKHGFETRWRKWPSYEQFSRTAVAAEVGALAGVIVGLSEWGQRRTGDVASGSESGYTGVDTAAIVERPAVPRVEPVRVEPVVVESVAVNDAEMVDWAV